MAILDGLVDRQMASLAVDVFRILPIYLLQLMEKVVMLGLLFVVIGLVSGEVLLEMAIGT